MKEKSDKFTFHNLDSDTISNDTNSIQTQNDQNVRSLKISFINENKFLLIDNLPKNITAKELKKLIINANFVRLSDFVFTENDLVLHNDDFIHEDNISLIYIKEPNLSFPFFVIAHLIPILIYFSYSLRESLLAYFTLIFFFAIYLNFFEKSMVINARISTHNFETCAKLIFLFFYSFLPFYNDEEILILT